MLPLTGTVSMIKYKNKSIKGGVTLDIKISDSQQKHY